jgi:DNA topoisomerase-2
MVRRQAKWNPGLIKLFDEIISNSVDHSKRPEGKHLDTIKVEIDFKTGELSVYDNGGIPVVEHPEEKMMLPTMLFGHLLSGENFDDSKDSDVTGQNGEGSSLVNIFSTKFTVETADGKKRFKQTWTGNMKNAGRVSIVDSDNHFTRISFIPDYQRLETTLGDVDNYHKIVKRIYDIAGCNSKLKVYLNGERIRINSFKDYIALYTDKYEYDDNADWQIGVSHSDEGYQHVSFVNTTETIQGGTHSAYIAYEIANKLREFFSRKHKVDVRPTEILNHMRIFINARIVNPRYDSQTKENLITEIKEYKTQLWTASDKFIARLIKSPIIESVLQWVEAKEWARQQLEAKKSNKDVDKMNIRKIIKLKDAILAGKEPEKCILFLVEGDSAAKAGRGNAGDNANRMGFLSLRGVPLNVNGVDISRILGKDRENEKKREEGSEFFQLMVAMGLKIGEKVTDIKQLRYGMIGIMTDADHDGAGHITGLLINNLYKFWPELFELGVIHRFVTPIVKVWVQGKKDPLSFFEEQDYKAWLQANPTVKFRSKYYKGLATSGDEEFREYLENINDHLIKVQITTPEDSEVIELAFGKTSGAADRRKDWLGLTE